MAPTVYMADLGPVAGHSDDECSDDSGGEQISTLILGFGVNNIRERRRILTSHHGRGYNLHSSSHPTTKENKARTSPTISIDNTVCSIETSPPNKRLKSCPSRLVLLNKRRGLLDITLRTVALIRRNHQLQMRLTALQAETKAFVRSVMSNPENQGIKLVTKPRPLEDTMEDSDGFDDDCIDK